MFEKEIKCLLKTLEDWKETFSSFIQELYAREERRDSARD